MIDPYWLGYGVGVFSAAIAFGTYKLIQHIGDIQTVLTLLANELEKRRRQSK